MYTEQQLKETWDEAISHAQDKLSGNLPVFKSFDEWKESLVKESDSSPCVSDSDCPHPSITYINSKWKFFCVECGQAGIESHR